MTNIKLIIEYNGLEYHGWQRQPNGLTIQEVLEESIKKITGETCVLTASGRTDAGVHAIAQTANFHTRTKIPPENIKKGLNAILPSDITIIDSCYVPVEFHARFNAKTKQYRYIILNRPYKSSFQYRYSWFIPYALDIEVMIKGMYYLKGEHDFSSFRASSCEANDAVRTINRLDVCKKDDTIIFDIEGNGFLKHMVRNIIGTLVDAGRGKIYYKDIKKILESKDRRNAGVTAPAHGLFLMGVKY